MKKIIFSTIIGITLVILAFPPSDSFATATGFPICAGAAVDCIITTSPPNPVTKDPGDGILLVWDEVQNFELTEDLKVDRVADPSAPFIIPDGTGYKILAGTIVSSHYVQWDPLDSSGTVTATMEFDSEIFAFITADQKMFDSDAQLGLPGINYNNFFNRGLEGGDITTIRGNEVDISWFASSPGDWTRLITAFSPAAADTDEDGIEDSIDNCPSTFNPDQSDLDEDGIGDACDNCPATFNPDQADTNENGIGDVCDFVEVDFEIKPDGETNKINCKTGKGNVPVAIFGSDLFDANTVEIELVSLNLVGQEPFQVSISHPGDFITHISDVDNDGKDDRIIHIPTRDFCDATIDGLVKEPIDIEIIISSIDFDYKGTDTVIISKR